jgi:hypothetical protein
MNTFWDAWGKDVRRGAVLFTGVLCVGLLAHYLFARVREGVRNGLPVALREIRNFDPDASGGPPEPGGPRTVAAKWVYRTKLAPKQWVWIHNSNGSVQVEPGKGDSLEVVAVKSSRRSAGATVRIVTEPYDGGVAICALREGQDTHCGPEEDFKLGSGRGMDVAVEFTVRLPRGVRTGATTVHGGVHVTGASAPIVAKTVIGDVDVETSGGPVTAASVNGSVRARMRAFSDTGAVVLGTVNGSVTAELPARLDAELEASTVNGSIATDYPLSVSGKFVSHKLAGTLGTGGRAVKISTVNGSVHVKKAL